MDARMLRGSFSPISRDAESAPGGHVDTEYVSRTRFQFFDPLHKSGSITLAVKEK